jgi:RNA polymerase sigma-70 factor (ECF subfamily)
MSEASDEALVASVVAVRDATAFEALVRRHQSRVRNWLRLLTRNSARADDLAQETFIRAWQRAHTFSGRGKFVSWLMKVAYNAFLEEQRGARLRTRIAATVSGLQGDEPAAGGGDEWPDLERMLAVLSADERLALVLCYAHGLSHSEIAEVIDMPLGTVKSHVHRAKAKIRERFALPESGACARSK